MRTLITLDYELFFGPSTGTVEACLLRPTAAVAAVARSHGAKLVLFVDAGYLVRLAAEQSKHPRLGADRTAILSQLDALVREGHEIQLHIHPHWEDSRWAPDGWRLDLSRFALHAFAPAQIGDIVRRYTACLRDIGGSGAACAYRAGGWVIQPFAPLREPLLENGVTIDSTVFAGGHRRGRLQPYDFRDAPAKSRWRFDTDPLAEDPCGAFLEVPIASRRVSPAFFWRMALAKKAGGARHRAFGDGRAVGMEGGDLVEKLARPSTSVVSVDGYKASFLRAAYDDYRTRGMDDFVVIGHPKAITPYSLRRLDEFLATGVETSTFEAYRAQQGRGLAAERIAA